MNRSVMMIVLFSVLPIFGGVKGLVPTWDWGVGNYYAVAVGEGYAFALTPTGMDVVSVAAPEAPYVVGRFRAPTQPSCIAVSGSTVLLGGSFGLMAIEVAVVGQPVVAAMLTERYVEAVTVRGTHVFAACMDGLRIFDIAQPRMPQLLGYSPMSAPCAIALQGDLLALASSRQLCLINVENLNQPMLIHQITGMGGFALAMRGNYLYLGALCGTSIGDGLVVMDITSPAHPQVAGLLDTSWCPVSIGLDGPCALLADSSGQVLMVDVGNPLKPARMFGIAAVGPTGLAVADGFCYVADQSGGLLILDTRNPLQPVLAGHLNLSGDVLDAAVWNEHLFVAKPEYGLRVLLMNEDAGSADFEPGCSAPAPAPNTVTLDIRGPFAVLSDMQGLRILDIDVPQTPFEVGALKIPYIKQVRIVNTTAVCLTETALVLVDIADVTAPRLIGFLPLYAGDWGNYVADRLWLTEALAAIAAYNPQGGQSLLLIDIRNPYQPEMLAALDLPGLPVDLAITDGRAYVLAAEGLSLIDISDPVMPRVSNYYAWLRGHALAIDGFDLYVASDDDLRVYNMRAAFQPQLMALAPAFAAAEARLRVYGEQVVLAGGRSGACQLFRIVRDSR